MAKKEAAAPTFSRTQLLQSKKYAQQKDLLNALLKADHDYTLKEVDTMIEDFLKGKVI